MTISQLVPFARSAGLTATAAALALTIGRVRQCGRPHPLRLAVGFARPADDAPDHGAGLGAGDAGCSSLVREQVVLFYLLVVVVYWCYGTQLSVFASTTADFYGTRNLGMNYGALFTAWGAAGVLGPLIAAACSTRRRAINTPSMPPRRWRSARLRRC